MDTCIDKILYPGTYPLPSLPNLQRAAIIHVQEASGGVAGMQEEFGGEHYLT